MTIRNGDRRDFRLENLELVSRAEWMRRNSRHNLPADLGELITLRAALTRRLRNVEARRKKP